MRARSTTLVHIVLCLLAAWEGFATAAEPEEILITGKVTGPPLWEVRNGDHSLWIFGLLSPLPRDIDFDVTPLEALIRDTDEVLTRPDLELGESLGPFKLIGLYRQYRRIRLSPDGRALDEVLAPELHRRLVKVKDLYHPRGDDFFELRPLFAAQELEQAMRKRAQLGSADFIGKRLRRLIRKHDVPVTELVVHSNLKYHDLLDAVADVPLEAEIACLAATVAKLDSDVEALQDRARAWAYGYMGEIYAMDFPDQQGSCANALFEGGMLGALATEMDALWLTHAERALAENTSTFAILEMHTLLSPSGLLAQLRGRGYEIVQP